MEKNQTASGYMCLYVYSGLNSDFYNSNSCISYSKPFYQVLSSFVVFCLEKSQDQ